jgi:crossover junction endonuclease MUS81
MIKIDCREHELIRLCKGLIESVPLYKDIVIHSQALSVGDIILCKNDEELVIIERKSIQDLASSIKDGRYEEQSYRLHGLQHHNHNIMYLVEGDINKPTKFAIDKKAIYSAMFSLNFYKGFSVCRSFSIEETAHIICHMAYKLGKENVKQPFYSHSQPTTQQAQPESYSNVIKKVKKENITPENIGEIMLCQIPGISSTSAVAVMKEFHSLQNLINKINEDSTCLNNISYVNTKGQVRKINKTVITNLTSYLKHSC